MLNHVLLNYDPQTMRQNEQKIEKRKFQDLMISLVLEGWGFSQPDLLH